MDSPGKALEICKQNIPSWESVTSVSMTLLTGTSNKVYLVEASGEVSPKKVIYRVYRYGSIVIRELERLTFRSLIGRAKVPNIYGEGEEWRLEEYFNGRSLNRQELKQEEFIQKIAGTLKSFHNVDMSDVLDSREDTILKNITAWQQKAVSRLPSLPTQYLEIFSELTSYATLSKFLNIYPNSKNLKFCHLDCNSMNFLYNESSGELVLIDYEYSGYSNSAMDLAFVLNETMFNYYHPEPPYFTFHPEEGPTDEIICKYVKEYGGDLDFAVDVMRCLSIVDLFWAVWDVCMYIEPAGFDFLENARIRYENFKTQTQKYEESGKEGLITRISKYFNIHIP
jgi:choline/ethanolamine kinase